MNMKTALIAFAAFAASTPAAAQCVWKWDCTNGQCVQVPICRSTLDIVPIKPIEITPLPPLQPIRPIQSQPLPPIGARYCQQRYICTNGQCAWRQVCQ
jgi:hypothetical protein